MLQERFIFADDDDRPEFGGAFKGILRPRIFGVDNLLDEVGECLNFPGYYGQNWNALSDCLRDFDWIDEKRICLFHRDVPVIAVEDLRIYLDVLRRAVDDWKEGEKHEFFALFPASTEDRIRRIMR